MIEDHRALGDICTKNAISIAPDAPIGQALKIMDERKISCLVVTDESRPAGIITERDLVRNISRVGALAGESVRSFMSAPPVLAHKELPYLEGYHLCAEHRVRHLIVVDEQGLLAGIVTETDFVRYLGLDAYVELKPVSGVMTKRPITVRAEQLVGDALELMSVNAISCIVVERGGRPIGILSERDVVRLSQSLDGIASYPIGSAMTSPVITVAPEMSLHEAAKIMRGHRIRRLVVVEESGSLAGVVTEHDLVKGLESRYTTFLRNVISRQSSELSDTRERLNEHLVLENLLRASLDMAILAADTDQLVWYLNPAARSVFGLDGQAATGKSLDELYRTAELERDSLECGIQAAREGRHYEFELVKNHRTSPRFLQCRIATIKDPEDRIQGYVHTLVDVTAAKKAEEARSRLQSELLQARKMEAIGQLTGGVAHDFNNILASVLGYARLALDSSPGTKNGALQGYLDEIYKAGKRAQDLVHQLLTFSRSGPQRPQHLSLTSLIQDVAKMLRATLPSTLSLKLTLDENTPAVYLDPVQVQQLLMNLVLNARDAISGHGAIAIGLHLARDIETISSVNRRPICGDWVELSVRDSGSGMSSQVLERAFEPFFTTKEIDRGSGMGLAVVHGIVTQNGGEILVESQLGVGTCFRALFPPSGDRGEPASQLPLKRLSLKQLLHRRHKGTSFRILIADDDTSIGAFLGELLERLGHICTVVTNGREALDLFKNAPAAFDLVITDQVMPNLTGTELAALIHETKPSLPVILITGRGDVTAADEVSKASSIKILPKPLEPEDVLDAVNSALEVGRS